VFPLVLSSSIASIGLPRASGGVSLGGKRPGAGRKPSPRERGCFYYDSAPVDADSAFPARAGVFPAPGTCRPSGCSLPRASGGVSHGSAETFRPRMPSPRERGCFLAAAMCGLDEGAFPARAGVFLYRGKQGLKGIGLPRASGGVPPPASPSSTESQPSPRERGCFY